MIFNLDAPLSQANDLIVIQDEIGPFMGGDRNVLGRTLSLQRVDHLDLFGPEGFLNDGLIISFNARLKDIELTGKKAKTNSTNNTDSTNHSNHSNDTDVTNNADNTSERHGVDNGKEAGWDD
jgi:hypothetical protein